VKQKSIPRTKKEIVVRLSEFGITLTDSKIRTLTVGKLEEMLAEREALSDGDWTEKTSKPAAASSTGASLGDDRKALEKKLKQLGFMLPKGASDEELLAMLEGSMANMGSEADEEEAEDASALVISEEALQAHAQASNARDALHVLQALKTSGVTPSAASYEMVIRAVLEGGGPRARVRERLAALTDELLEHHTQATEKGVVVDPETYRAVLRACGYAGRWMEAREILEEFCEAYPPQSGVAAEASASSPNLADFELAMAICREEGAWEAAYFILRLARVHGITAEMSTYRLAAEIFLKAERYDVVLSLLEDSRNQGLGADAVLYEAAISASEVMGAEAWMPVLKQEIVEALSKSDGSEAIATMSCAWPQPTPTWEELRLRDFAAGIRACGRCGDWQQAVAMFEALPARGLSPDSGCSNAAVWALARAGIFDDSLLSLAGQFKQTGLEPDSMTYLSAMLASALKDDFEAVKTFYDEYCESYPRWWDGIPDKSSIDVTHLPPQDAAMATRILVEVMRRHPKLRRMKQGPLTIRTSDEDVERNVDAKGFDSNLKRYVHEYLTQDLKIDANHLAAGVVLIANSEVRRLADETAEALGVRTKRQKKTALLEKAEATAYQSDWEDD